MRRTAQETRIRIGRAEPGWVLGDGTAPERKRRCGEPMRSREVAVEAERLRLSPPEVGYTYLSGLGPPDPRLGENLPDIVFDALVAWNEALIRHSVATTTKKWVSA